jgi:hypothetical protein
MSKLICNSVNKECPAWCKHRIPHDKVVLIAPDDDCTTSVTICFTAHIFFGTIIKCKCIPNSCLPEELFEV